MFHKKKRKTIPAHEDKLDEMLMVQKEIRDNLGKLVDILTKIGEKYLKE